MKFSIAKRRNSSGEEGTFFVLIAIFIVALMAMAGFSVDIGRTYDGLEKIRIAADSASIAGAALLPGSATGAASVSAARDRAFELAKANGLTIEELGYGSTAYSSTSNVGGIEVGTWTPTGTSGAGTFTPAVVWSFNPANYTTTSPVPAIRVTTSRTIPTTFAKIIGQESFVPHHVSVSVFSTQVPINTTSCVAPFGLTTTSMTVPGSSPATYVPYGTVITVSSSAPGNWGKLDIGGNMSSGSNFPDAMLNGTTCNTTLASGSSISQATGASNQLGNLFDTIAARPYPGNVLTMAIVDPFGNGNSDTTIRGFSRVKVLSATGNGKNWSAQLQVLDEGDPNGSGGPGCLQSGCSYVDLPRGLVR